MSTDDAARITTPAGVATETGFAPSVEQAWKEGGDIFGVSFPTEGLSPRMATAADANNWYHFRPGGFTAIHAPESDWYLVNKTREFVADGGRPAPPGTYVFRFEEGGDFVPLWGF